MKNNLLLQASVLFAVLLNFNSIAFNMCMMNDCKDGYGSELNEKLISYTGEYKNGKFHGRGVLVDFNTGKGMQGMWKNGQLVASFPVDTDEIEQEYLDRLSKKYSKFEDPTELKSFKEQTKGKYNSDFYFSLGKKYYDYSMNFQAKKDHMEILKFKYYLNQSVQAYTKCIELSKQAAGAVYNRAMSYESLEDYDKAIDDYSKYLEAVPNDIEAFNAIALNYSRIENLLKALEIYALVFERFNSPRALYDQAEIYERSGDKKSALELYKKFYSIGVFSGNYERGNWSINKSFLEDKIKTLKNETAG